MNTIETSRLDTELEDVFDQYRFPNKIGPGVSDIHSPNNPSVDAVAGLMCKAAQCIPVHQLWVNPRDWQEVKSVPEYMVSASRQLAAYFKTIRSS